MWQRTSISVNWMPMALVLRMGIPASDSISSQLIAPGEPSPEGDDQLGSFSLELLGELDHFFLDRLSNFCQIAGLVHADRFDARDKRRQAVVTQDTARVRDHRIDKDGNADPVGETGGDMAGGSENSDDREAHREASLFYAGI